MRTNMFSKALSSFAVLLLFVGFSSSFAQAQAPVNIALNKPATQSSEDAGGAAGRANDGNPILTLVPVPSATQEMAPMSFGWLICKAILRLQGSVSPTELTAALSA